MSQLEFPKSIHDMELHEMITDAVGYTRIIKVPGGWIYRFFEGHQVESKIGNYTETEYIPNSVFVPL